MGGSVGRGRTESDFFAAANVLLARDAVAALDERVIDPERPEQTALLADLVLTRTCAPPVAEPMKSRSGVRHGS